jgi:hypothetical protein
MALTAKDFVITKAKNQVPVFNYTLADLFYLNFKSQKLADEHNAGNLTITARAVLVNTTEADVKADLRNVRDAIIKSSKEA